jgi:hypothetical protein
VHSGAFGAQNIIVVFSMLMWAWYGFRKKRARTRYFKHVFLLPVGSIRHLMHSGAFGARNINALFFMLVWARCSFHNKRTGTRYTELATLLHVGHVGHIVHSSASGARNIITLFSCSGGPGAVSRKSASGHVALNLCFCNRWNLWVM